MFNKYMKKMFNILGYKMEIKMTLRFHLITLRMATINDANNNTNTAKGEGIKEPLSTTGGNLK
jgi:hypothetical protein